MTRVAWNKGLKTGIKPYNYVEIPKEELIEHIKQGLNAETIGNIYNVHKGTITKKLHEYGLFQMYEEHAIRWKDSIIDIKKEGLKCGDCHITYNYEDRNEYFHKSGKTVGRGRYTSQCKTCVSKAATERYSKLMLEKDPDWKRDSDLFYDDTHMECKTCNDVKLHSEYPPAQANIRGLSSHCRDCTYIKQQIKYREDMIITKYKQYSSIMRSEGNDCDLTLEEFKERWPKDNRCSVRRDIIMDFYPAEDKELWNKGGRHWPCAPSIDHFYPDKEMSKDNFWVISWRANETKSDMLGVEIEALYHAYMQKKGKVYTGEDALVLVKLEQDLETMKDYVGKYTDERLESIKRHRKL